MTPKYIIFLIVALFAVCSFTQFSEAKDLQRNRNRKIYRPQTGAQSGPYSARLNPPNIQTFPALQTTRPPKNPQSISQNVLAKQWFPDDKDVKSTTPRFRDFLINDVVKPGLKKAATDSVKYVMKEGLPEVGHAVKNGISDLLSGRVFETEHEPVAPVMNTVLLPDGRYVQVGPAPGTFYNGPIVPADAPYFPGNSYNGPIMPGSGYPYPYGGTYY